MQTETAEAIVIDEDIGRILRNLEEEVSWEETDNVLSRHLFNSAYF